MAKQLGVPEPLRIHNGDMVRLAPGPSEVVDVVPSGRLYLDGSIMIDASETAVRDRRKAAFGGVVFVAVPLDAANRLAGHVEVETVGVPQSDGLVKLTDWVVDAVERVIPSNGKLTPERAEGDIQLAVKREMKRRWGKKPIVVVSFVDV